MSGDQTYLAMPGTVESVVKSRTNGRLIAVAAQLHIGPDDAVIDVTYGRGGFWSEYRPRGLVAHDLRVDGVDFRDLPHADASFDVVMFDPPYIPQGGRDSDKAADFRDRYGLDEVPMTVGELEELISAGVHEVARVLKPRGRLFAKCMDYVNGGRYQQGRHHMVQEAMDAGLVQIDEFVHHSGVGMGNNTGRQVTSRRAHSFLCVFRKPDR